MNSEEKNINAEAAERLALYVRHRGVDVLTTQSDSAELVAIDIDQSITDTAKILEEAVYAYPALLGSYCSVDVAVAFERFVVAPEQSDPSAVAAGLWRDDVLSRSTVVVDPCFGDAKFISLADKSLDGFASRTFGHVSLHNRLACLVNFFAGLSRPVNRVKMYAHLAGESMIDIVALTAEGLLMANTFSCPDLNDALYFVMASVEDCGLDTLDDELVICGNRDRCAAVTDPLRQYINSVMPLLLPDGDSSLPLELLTFKK